MRHKAAAAGLKYVTVVKKRQVFRAVEETSVAIHYVSPIAWFVEMETYPGREHNMESIEKNYKIAGLLGISGFA